MTLARSDYLAPARDTAQAKKLILVTGATGFLGKHLTRTLREQGVAVRALGRNLRIGLELAEMGADFCPVDLRDRAAVIRACQGVTGVVHAGALSSAWGKRRDFFDINIGGTENVIAGCLAHGVKRLVYISSPSVMSRHAVQLDLDETHRVADEPVSIYSETKIVAEKRVAAVSDRLETVILRPKAIYGPGDQALFPRIIESLARKRLPVFGDGETVTNITHVTDVVQACLLALESPQATGNTYLITGGENIKLYEIIGEIAASFGYPRPSKKVSVARGMKIARALEAVWRTLPLVGEPPLTQYKLTIMAHSQTYDISAARRDLGYEPKVGWREGTLDFIARFKAESTDKAELKAVSEPPATDPTPVKLTLLSAGATRARERFFGHSDSWREMDIPALFALIEHPQHGPVLFDTGYSTHFHEATARFPDALYRILTPVHVTPEQNADAQLAARGVNPNDVQWVVLSHFDPDHVGGLKGFPNARIVCHWRAWQALAGKRGIAALRERLLTELLPTDLTARLVMLPDPSGSPIGPFEHSLDLFGDGALRLVSLPGHADGMVGAFVTTDEGESVFLAADSCWSRRLIDTGDATRGVHRFIAKNRGEQEETYRKLIALRAAMPDTHIVPSHCPLAADELGLG